MARRRRVLLLGGTGEAAALAARLAGDARIEVTTSLAGRTRMPAAIAGNVRVGGFGGADGLADYLARARIDVVIDATHPYAATMPKSAADACARAGVPRLRLVRPPWARQEGDHWIGTSDLAGAAKRISGVARRVFMTTGQRDLEAFAHLTDVWFLIRLIEPPETVPMSRCQVILHRGPFDTEKEMALMRAHKIEALVSKNSGGAATYGKIAAARALGLPVIMIDRPAQPAGDAVGTVDGCLEWLEARLAQNGASFIETE